MCQTNLEQLYINNKSKTYLNQLTVSKQINKS